VASPACAALAQLQGDDATPTPRLPSTEPTIREQLAAAAPGRQRRLLLEAYLQAQLAQVLKLTPSRIDVHKAVRTMGLDSLMALELRTCLEASLGLTLPATVIWNYPTIATLATHLADMMSIPLEEPAALPAKARAHTESRRAGSEELDLLVRNIAQLSEAEVERLLHEKMRGS